MEPTNVPSSLAHYFKFDNLTTGLVDPINAKTATLAQRGGYETTVTTDTPTQVPNEGSLLFVNGGKGGQLLSREDCNTWEDTTGSWSASIWFRSEVANESALSQSRIFSRDFSDGWGLRINQSQASGSQGIIMMAQPGSLNTGFTVDINTWYHAVLVHTGTYGATINAGGSYVNGTSYEIVSLGDQNDAYWEGINADDGAGDNDHEVGSKFIATADGTLAGTGTIIREYAGALSFYMNGVLQSTGQGASSNTNIRTNEAAGLGVGANNELNGGQTSQNFKGSMSDIRLYTKALTQAEVSSLYTGAGLDHTSTKLEVGPELTFSQTFTENPFSTKTIHTENFFESSTITKANKANFAFKLPVLKETDLDIVKDRLIDCSTFDLYVKTELDVFKLEKSVLTTGTFEITRSNPLRLSVSGEAAKLTLVGAASSYVIPGLPATVSPARTYLVNRQLDVTLNSADISTNIYSISAELQNEIEWTSYDTVNEALNVTSASNAIYPTDFTIKTKTLSGSIGQYITDTTSSDLQNFTTGESLRIKAGEVISSTFYGFDINMSSCSFTNRANVGDVFTQNYDWRFTDNSTLLSNVIKLR